MARQGQPRHVTEKEFLRAYKMCKTTRQIAEMLGCATGHVLRLCQRHGVEKPQPTTRAETYRSYADPKRPATRTSATNYGAIQEEIDKMEANFIPPKPRRSS